jgi:hypothetical protein
MEEASHIQIAVLTERLETLTKQVEALEQKHAQGNSRINAVFGGIVIACILMVINISVEVVHAI